MFTRGTSCAIKSRSLERARRFRGHYKIIFYRHSWQARVEEAACNKLRLWNDAARHINHDDVIYSFLTGSFHVISCPPRGELWRHRGAGRIRFIGHLRRHGHTANHCGLITNVNCKTVSSWLATASLEGCCGFVSRIKFSTTCESSRHLVKARVNFKGCKNKKKLSRESFLVKAFSTAFTKSFSS